MLKTRFAMLPFRNNQLTHQIFPRSKQSQRVNAPAITIRQLPSFCRRIRWSMWTGCHSIEHTSCQEGWIQEGYFESSKKKTLFGPRLAVGHQSIRFLQFLIRTMVFQSYEMSQAMLPSVKIWRKDACVTAHHPAGCNKSF